VGMTAWVGCHSARNIVCSPRVAKRPEQAMPEAEKKLTITRRGWVALAVPAALACVEVVLLLSRSGGTEEDSFWTNPFWRTFEMLRFLACFVVVARGVFERWAKDAPSTDSFPLRFIRNTEPLTKPGVLIDGISTAILMWFMCYIGLTALWILISVISR
ncbi:unnamed protein product, partial [marine sediment metagenome]